MSYQNGTTHYNLPQTIGSDKRDWSDTNKAYADIDSAIYSAKNGMETLTPQVSNLKSELSDVKEDVATNTSDIASIGGRVTSSEQNINNLNNVITDVRNDSEDMITAYKEHSATASRNYNIGDYFIYNNTLYIATRQITQNSTIVPNTNCNTANVMSEIINVKNSLNVVKKIKLTASSTWRKSFYANYQTINNLISNMSIEELSFVKIAIVGRVQNSLTVFTLTEHIPNGSYTFDSTTGEIGSDSEYVIILDPKEEKCGFIIVHLNSNNSVNYIDVSNGSSQYDFYLLYI